jgi:hypothetical protein
MHRQHFSQILHRKPFHVIREVIGPKPVLSLGWRALWERAAMHECGCIAHCPAWLLGRASRCGREANSTAFCVIVEGGNP